MRPGETRAPAAAVPARGRPSRGARNVASGSQWRPKVQERCSVTGKDLLSGRSSLTAPAPGAVTELRKTRSPPASAPCVRGRPGRLALDGARHVVCLACSLSPCPLGVSSTALEVWNARWQGKWRALFPGAGYVPPAVAEGGEAPASRGLRAQGGWASASSAARAESGGPERASERARAPLRFPAGPPGGGRGAPAAAFGRTLHRLEGDFPSGSGWLRAFKMYNRRHVRWHVLPSP